MNSKANQKNRKSKSVGKGSKFRVIQDEGSELDNEEEDVYQGIHDKAHWSGIVPISLVKHRAIALILVKEDLAMVDQMLDMELADANPQWQLLFDPRQFGMKKKTDNYDLVSLSVEEMEQYAQMTS